MFSSQSDMNSGISMTPMQMSGAALPHAPSTAPNQPGTGPQVVGPPEIHRSGSKAWIWLLVLAVAAGAGYWGWQKQQEKKAQANVVTVRTAPVQVAPIAKTLRLTGVTAAEKYVSLIAPSLRGGRGGSNGGGGNSGGSSRGGGTTVSSNAGSSSSSGSSTASSTSTIASAGTALASTSGAASSGGASSSGFSGGGDSLASSAGSSGSTLRSARTASGGSSRVASSSRSSRSSGASSSATLGSDGLGSTSSQIPGGGGSTGGGGGGGSQSSGGGSGGRSSAGGGRGGDFMMQLQMLAPNGNKVSKGDVVAEFDRQYMLLRLDDNKANVEQSESSQKASMANLEVTRKSYEQQINAARNLVEKSELDMKTLPVRSAIEAERYRLALEEAKANLKQLQEAAKHVEVGERATLKMSELDLQATRLELRRAQANADRMVVKAPMDGLVVVQNTFRSGDFGAIQEGDQIRPGQMFMQVVDQSSMVIDATVNQVDVQHLRLGQKARVRFDAFPGLQIPAHVITIGAITKSAGTRASFKKEIAVKLRLDGIDPRVIPDLSVSADVILAEEESATVIPSAALMSDNSLAGGEPKPYVMVRNAAGKWERRDIQLGVISNTQAAVHSGLKPGEIVALEPPNSAPTTDSATS